MDKVKRHKNNLITAGVAVGLGLLTKSLVSFNTVGANSVKQAVGSFVVIAAAAVGTDYVIEDEFEKFSKVTKNFRKFIENFLQDSKNDG